MLTIKEVQKEKQLVLVEAANSLLGTCKMFDFSNCIESGIMQVFTSVCSSNFSEKCDYIEEHLHDTFLPLFTENDLEEALNSAGIEECGECGWWCDTVHYESPECDSSVCDECNENHQCGECSSYPCECD